MTCSECGTKIEYDAVDTQGHRLPDHFDTKLLKDGVLVGLALDSGDVLCSPCLETF